MATPKILEMFILLLHRRKERQGTNGSTIQINFWYFNRFHHIKIQNTTKNSGQFNREILEQSSQSILKVEAAQWRSEQYGDSFKLQACGHIRRMQSRTHSNHSLDISP